MPIIYLETEATNAAGSYIFENLMNVQLFLASLNIYNNKWYNFTKALDRLIYELEVALLHQRVRIYFILWKFPRKILLFNIYISKFWWFGVMENKFTRYMPGIEVCNQLAILCCSQNPSKLCSIYTTIYLRRIDLHWCSNSSVLFCSQTEKQILTDLILV